MFILDNFVLTDCGTQCVPRESVVQLFNQTTYVFLWRYFDVINIWSQIVSVKGVILDNLGMKWSLERTKEQSWTSPEEEILPMYCTSASAWHIPEYLSTSLPTEGSPQLLTTGDLLTTPLLHTLLSLLHNLETFSLWSLRDVTYRIKNYSRNSLSMNLTLISYTLLFNDTFPN